MKLSSEKIEEITTSWRTLAQAVKDGVGPTPESDAYASALEACAVTLSNAAREETDESGDVDLTMVHGDPEGELFGYVRGTLLSGQEERLAAAKERALAKLSKPKEVIVSVEFVFTQTEDDDEDYSYLELSQVQRGLLPEGVHEDDLSGIGERFAQSDRYQLMLVQIGNVIDGGDVLKP